MEDEDDEDSDQNEREKDDSDSDAEERKGVFKQKVRRHWRRRYHHQEESTQMKEEDFDRGRRENIKKVFSCFVHETIGEFTLNFCTL